MQPFTVTDVERISEILKTFSTLDEIRWNDASNYNLINYCRDDLNADEKLLTHYLCYIMDRQMPFKRVWDIGGYVISDIVRNYTSQSEEDIWDQVLESYVRRNSRDKIRLEAEVHPDRVNDTLNRYGISGETVSFASRYMPEDLILIYRTLGILERVADRSLARFICMAFEENKNIKHNIKKMALALNQLTYEAVGAVYGSEFDSRLEEMKLQVSDFELNIEEDFYLFGRKRLWCSLRDYLKSKEFNVVFVAAIRDTGYPSPDRWKRESDELKAALKVLELPGDVWNNADIFRKGLFDPYIANERKTWDMPRTIREIYNFITQTGATCFYPEQLDVTFDFVPRMCQREMCDVCIFGAGIEKVCHEKAGLLCPVVLYSCGYKHECNPSSCDFKNDSVRGFCRSSSYNSET